MKTYSKDGKTWFERQEDGKTYVGFTEEFLASLDGCWHMMAAGGKRTEIKEGQPLCAVETNDGLFSVASPIAGVISVFDNAAMNFPEKLTDDSVVVHMTDKPEEKKTLQEQLDDVLAEMPVPRGRAAQAAIRQVDWQQMAAAPQRFNDDGAV